VESEEAKASLPGRWWRRILRWTETLASGKRGLWGIGIATALESSIVPFPVELFLIPAFVAYPKRVWRIATAALLGAMVGSAAFYLVGWALYDSVGLWLIDFFGIEARMQAFETDVRQHGFWIVFAISFLPLPLQVATLGSGAFGYAFLPFMAAIVLSRALRFHGLGALTLWFGPRVETFLTEAPLWQKLLLTVFMAGSIALVVWLSSYIA